MINKESALRFALVALLIGGFFGVTVGIGKLFQHGLFFQHSLVEDCGQIIVRFPEGEEMKGRIYLEKLPHSEKEELISKYCN